MHEYRFLSCMRLVVPIRGSYFFNHAAVGNLLWSAFLQAKQQLSDHLGGRSWHATGFSANQETSRVLIYCPASRLLRKPFLWWPVTLEVRWWFLKFLSFWIVQQNKFLWPVMSVVAFGWVWVLALMLFFFHFPCTFYVLPCTPLLSYREIFLPKWTAHLPLVHLPHNVTVPAPPTVYNHSSFPWLNSIPICELLVCKFELGNLVAWGNSLTALKLWQVKLIPDVNLLVCALGERRVF